MRDLWSDDEIESEIRQAILDGCTRFKDILAHVEQRRPTYFRTVDKALQRLKRRGEITFDHANGWQDANY